MKKLGVYLLTFAFIFVNVIGMQILPAYAGTTLSSKWTVVRDNPSMRSLSSDDKLTVSTECGDLYGTDKNNLKNIVLTSPSTSDFTVTTKLTFSPNHNFQSAGLIAYVDDDKFFTVSRRSHSFLGGNILGVVSEGSTNSEKQTPDTVTGAVYLKLDKSGSSFTGSFSADGESWTPIYAAQTNTSITGSNVKVGVYACNGGDDTAGSIDATFEGFTLNGAPVAFASTSANTAPAATGAAITGTAQVNSTLTGSYTFTDADSDAEGASTYRWLSSDTAAGTYAAISGATAKTYVPTADMAGKYIKFEVTPVDSKGLAGTGVQSAAAGAVAASNSVYLSDISYESGTVGFGSIQMNKSTDGHTLTLMGSSGSPVTYAKGLGIHAASTITYDAQNKGYQYFEAYAGVDQENANGTASIVFQVFADSTKVYDSGVMGKSTAQKYIKVDVSGAQKVKLVVTDGGDGINADHGDWCDAKFIYAPGAQTRLDTVSFKTPKKWLNVNDTAATTVAGKLVDGSVADFAAGGQLNYASSDASVASVDTNGVITAKADGAAQITCTATLNGSTKTSYINIIVGNGGSNAWFVKSPDNKLNAIVFTVGGNVYYTVYSNNQLVLDDAPMGINTSIEDFTGGLTFKGRSDATINESYPMVAGKKSTYVNNAAETTLTFTKNGHDVNIIVRAYDDGIAFRYSIDGQGSYTVSGETSGYRLPEGSTVKAMPYNKAYEGSSFNTYTYDQMNQIYGMPFLVNTPDNNWALLVEAGLNQEPNLTASYCGSVLKPAGNGLMSVTYVPEQISKGAINITLPFKTPWRAAIIGTPEAIAESTMAENLNPPSQISDTSWIKPGVTSWTWLNGDPTDDEATYKRYVDLSAEMGWQYILMDEPWQPKPDPNVWSYSGWYPWVDNIISYANSKGIGVLVWSHYKDLSTPEKRQRLQEWAQHGIKGIKVDFFDSEAQDQIQIYDDIAKAALENHLVVNFHGCDKPTGERRTWPNILTREAVYGGEQKQPNAQFDCTLPFTRNVVGPMDYTPYVTYYGGQNVTYGHLGALHVVFESGIPCFADKPDRYRQSVFYSFLKAFPATWDDTKVLEGDPGQYATFARRSGENWYVGAICNNARTANIPLDFLGDGTYYAAIYKDGVTNQDIAVELKQVTNTDTLQIPMSLHGGCSIKITRTKPGTASSITLDQSSVTLKENATITLNAQINPQDADLKVLNWTSDNPEVATVQNGVISALKPGYATITAATLDKSVQATCSVTVLKTSQLKGNWTVVKDNPVKRMVGNGGELVITTENGELYGTSPNSQKNIVLTTPSGSDFTVTTKVTFTGAVNYQSAGLIAYVDDDNYFSVLRRYHSYLGNKIFGLVNEKNGSASEPATPDTLTNSGAVYLKLVKSGTGFSGYYSADGGNWTQISTTQTNASIAGASNIKVGIYASNGGSSSAPGITATFESFTLDGQVIPFANVNTAPTAADVSISGTAKVGETLTGSYTYADADSDAEGASTYRWLASDSETGTYTAIPGATGKAYIPTADMAGKYIKFEVTPVDGYGLAGTAVLSAAVGPVSSKSSSGGGHHSSNGNNIQTQPAPTPEPIPVPTPTPAPEKKSFSDVGGSSYSWAKDAVEELAAKGIIKGTAEGKFEPAKNITRADFITLLVRALNLKADFDSNFVDVSKDAYYYEALGIAKKLGVATGVGDGRFNPGAEISRQDMMVLVERALKVAGKPVENGTVSEIGKFADASQVAEYAKESVAKLAKEGIIKGSGNAIHPNGTATRAETAVIIYRVYKR